MDKTLNQLNVRQIPPRFIRPSMRNRPVKTKPVDAEDVVGSEEHYGSDFIKLLVRMRYGTSGSEREDWILEECKVLFAQDYICRYVDNLDNNIPGIHPKVLVIPIAEIDPDDEEKTMKYDEVEYLKQEQDPSSTAVARFPCPVILCNGKYICRSRYPPIIRARQDEPRAETPDGSEPPRQESNLLKMVKSVGGIKKGYFARKDVDFLNSIDVRYLSDITNSTECDFKGDISNSEGLRNIYERIEIISMPYPSRENFTTDSIENIQKTTKEYLLTLLQKLVEGEGGILIQSFRGCDRAALFTSLLRLSLWADGVAHKTLTLYEIVFLTLAYDWYLFGYRMYENQTPFEDMMEFLFNFLKLVSSEEFSIYRMLEAQKKVKEASDDFPKIRPSRHVLVQDLSRHLLESLHKSTQYMNSLNNPPE